MPGGYTFFAVPDCLSDPDNDVFRISVGPPNEPDPGRIQPSGELPENPLAFGAVFLKSGLAEYVTVADVVVQEGDNLNASRVFILGRENKTHVPFAYPEGDQE